MWKRFSWTLKFRHEVKKRSQKSKILLQSKREMEISSFVDVFPVGDEQEWSGILNPKDESTTPLGWQDGGLWPGWMDLHQSPGDTKTKQKLLNVCWDGEEDHSSWFFVVQFWANHFLGWMRDDASQESNQSAIWSLCSHKGQWSGMGKCGKWLAKTGSCKWRQS